ncbi:MAG: hypothetical protein WCB04_15175 [Mycobacteriales bacterium]
MRIGARSSRVSAAGLLAVALAVSACGGSGTSGNADKGSSGGSTKTSGASAFCAELKTELKGYNAVFPRDFSNVDELKRYGEFVKKSNASLAKVAPAEIADDVKYQVSVSNAAADAYAKGTRPSQAVAAKFRTPEYTAAAKKVSAYASSKCGIGPSPAPSSS